MLILRIFLLSEHKSASHNARVRSFRSVRLYAIASFHEPFASSDDSFAGGQIVPDSVVNRRSTSFYAEY